MLEPLNSLKTYQKTLSQNEDTFCDKIKMEEYAEDTEEKLSSCLSGPSLGR